MTPWRRFVAVLAFEAALVVVAVATDRLTTALVVVVGAVAVIEVIRLWRALRGRAAAPVLGDEVRPSVVGRDLAAREPSRRLDERLAEVDDSTGGIPVGAVPLEDPQELVLFIDVDPAELEGYDWTVALYDEVWLFVDDDAVAEHEHVDPLESRLAGVDGVRSVLREDREVVHVAASGLTADQLHAAAVAAIADVARVTARLRDEP